MSKPSKIRRRSRIWWTKPTKKTRKASLLLQTLHQHLQICRLQYLRRLPHHLHHLKVEGLPVRKTTILPGLDTTSLATPFLSAGIQALCLLFMEQARSACLET